MSVGKSLKGWKGLRLAVPRRDIARGRVLLPVTPRATVAATPSQTRLAEPLVCVLAAPRLYGRAVHVAEEGCSGRERGFRAPG